MNVQDEEVREAETVTRKMSRYVKLRLNVEEEQVSEAETVQETGAICDMDGTRHSAHLQKKSANDAEPAATKSRVIPEHTVGLPCHSDAVILRCDHCDSVFGTENAR